MGEQGAYRCRLIAVSSPWHINTEPLWFSRSNSSAEILYHLHILHTDVAEVSPHCFCFIWISRAFNHLWFARAKKRKAKIRKGTKQGQGVLLDETRILMSQACSQVHVLTLFWKVSHPSLISQTFLIQSAPISSFAHLPYLYPIRFHHFIQPLDFQSLLHVEQSSRIPLQQ